MPITRASGQGDGVLGSGVSLLARAFPGNVATGSLVVVGITHYNPLLADLNAGPYKSAGTATLGAWLQHGVLRFVEPGGDIYGVTIWSAPVTAGGSLTIEYANGSGGSYMTLATDELLGADLSSSRALTPVTNSSNGSTAVDSGNLTASGGGAFFGVMAYGGGTGDTTITPDAAFTQVYEYESWAAMTGSHIIRLVSGATTDSASWSLGASRPWAAVATFFKEAGTPPPTQPASVTVGSVTTTGATASWTDSSSTETGFKVEIAASPYSSWSAVSGSPTAANATSLAITGLTPNTLYKVRVASTNAGGDSAWTESVEFRTVASVKHRPTSDVAAGAWTANVGGALYAAVDEETPSDADFISTSVAGSCDLGMPSITDPAVSYGHTVRYRFRSPTNDSFRVQLMQGTTVISTDPTTRSPGSTFTTYSWTLSAAETDAITNYAALRIRLTVL